MKEIIWRGRKVHESKDSFKIGLKATICAILALVGILLFSSFTFGSVILGGCFIAAGVRLSYNVYKEIQSPNELEEALKYLTNQTNLDNLPEIKWKTEAKRGPNSRELISCFDASLMTLPVMALKENGKTIAVAIKYFDPAYDHGPSSKPEHMVTIFSFKERFKGGSRHSYEGSTEKNPTLAIQERIYAREGQLLENLLRGKQE